MDRDQLKDKMSAKSKGKESIKKKDIRRIITRAIDNSPAILSPGDYNLIIVMEELAELQKEISKFIRRKGDRIGLLEELADVIVCTEYIKDICCISDKELKKMIKIKAERLSNQLDEVEKNHTIYR